MSRATRIWGILSLATLGIVGTIVFQRLSGPPVFNVASGDAFSSAVQRIPTGATVLLEPGTHASFTINRQLTVVAEPGAVVRGPIQVLADGVHLVGIPVRGGESGIVVRGAEGVELHGVTVRGAHFQGIEVVDAAATVEGCTVTGLRSPYGQGVEVRNTNGRPRTVVRGCVVSSGQEGLVSHVSRVEFIGNRVTGTTLRAIAVTEMSEGLVSGNVVEGVAGSALYCGDMSHCDFRTNVVAGVVSDPSGVKTRAGYGAVAWYYCAMRLTGNRFEDTAARPVAVLTHSILADRSPLALWPPGWRGAIPGVWVTLMSLTGLGLVALALRPFVRYRGEGPEASDLAVGRRRKALWILGAGFLAQTFHMLEHFVQVYQVYVAQSPNHSGLLGSVVDTEWVHFGFNLLVLGFLAWAWWVLHADLARGPATLLLAALSIQGWHMVEHTAKIIQHIITGANPAPGLVGHSLGLVWFHFGINLAVYVGTAAAAAALLARLAPIRSLARSGFRQRPQEYVSPA